MHAVKTSDDVMVTTEYGSAETLVAKPDSKCRNKALRVTGWILLIVLIAVVCYVSSTWTSLSHGAQQPSSHRLIRAHDTIDLQPDRMCSECWECYACTHDEHYGLVGNCVPILGCTPSTCYSADDCGGDRTCVDGSCEECASYYDCDGYRECYYGQCRDPCDTSSDCTADASGDMCENGFCVCSGYDC